jgi:hypothetical protein
VGHSYTIPSRIPVPTLVGSPEGQYYRIEISIRKVTSIVGKDAVKHSWITLRSYFTLKRGMDSV